MDRLDIVFLYGGGGVSLELMLDLWSISHFIAPEVTVSGGYTCTDQWLQEVCISSSS